MVSRKGKIHKIYYGIIWSQKNPEVIFLEFHLLKLCFKKSFMPINFFPMKIFSYLLYNTTYSQQRDRCLFLEGIHKF